MHTSLNAQSYLSDSLIQASLEKLSRQASTTYHQINERTTRTIRQITKQEQRLLTIFKKTDSALIGKLSSPKYDKYTQTRSYVGKFSGPYLGKIDSLHTALRFLDSQFKWNSTEVTKALNQLQTIQEAFSNAEQLRKYAYSRNAIFNEQLKHLKQSRYLRKYNKRIARYTDNLRELRRLANDPSKIEEGLISLVVEKYAFKKFFTSHSQLARLFSLPGGFAESEATVPPGIQTRESLEQFIRQRFGTNMNVQQIIRENAPAAQAQLLKSKAKIAKPAGSLGNTKEPISHPDNTGAAIGDRSFLKHFQYGGNIQTQKASYYFPVTADIALSAGYKLGKSAVLGVAVSYKVGLGTGWKNIVISHEGIGLRSFADIRILKNIFISGGYEQNYKSGFSSIQQLHDESRWISSGLVGLKKSYSVSRKLNGNFQVLWDFLSYNKPVNVPPVLFRIGYELK